MKTERSMLLQKNFVIFSLIIASFLALASCGPEGNAPPTAVTNNTRLAPELDRRSFWRQNLITPTAQEQSTKIDNRPSRLKINIGIMLPLSGDTANVGQALLNAATLALFDAKDQRLELIPADTKGTPTGATQAINYLINNNVDIIIGPLFSESIKAAHPIAKKQNIKIIGFSTDHDVAGDGVYLLSFRPEEQVSRIIKYASNQRYKKFAALIPDTLYGGRIMSILGPLVATQFNELVALETYPNNASLLDDPVKRIANYNFRRQEFIDEMAFLRSLGSNDDLGQEYIDEIKNLETLGNVNFDAILLPEGGAMLGSIAPLLSYYEIDLNKVKILGTGLWHDPMLFREPQLQGGWFAAPEDDITKKYIARYEDAFSTKPPRLFSLGYDAMALIANIVRNQHAPKFSNSILTNPNGFNGIDGIFRFHQSGLAERGLAVYEIKTGSFVKIEPSPKTFIQEEKSLYLETPIEFTPKFDPVFGLKGDVPSLLIEAYPDFLQKQNLEILMKPSYPSQ